MFQTSPMEILKNQRFLIDNTPLVLLIEGERFYINPNINPNELDSLDQIRWNRDKVLTWIFR